VSTASPPTPADNVATLLRCLTESVAGLGGGDRLSSWLVALIVGCIRDIEQGFARLAACLAAGTYVPCRDAPRRGPAVGKPRRQKPLPQKFGWLLPSVPGGASIRTQPEFTVRDPEMAAPLAQPPAPMASRPARSVESHGSRRRRSRQGVGKPPPQPRPPRRSKPPPAKRHQRSPGATTRHRPHPPRPCASAPMLGRSRLGRQGALARPFNY